MFAVGFLVIGTLSTLVTGSDYLIAVFGRCVVSFEDDSGGSVRVSYINYNRNQSRAMKHGDIDIRLDEQISTTHGYDNSAILISCSNSAVNPKVFAGRWYNSYPYNVFSPLAVTGLGTRYVVSSCFQNDFEYSVLVITAYTLKTEVSLRFDANVEFSYDGQKYEKGDTFSFSLRAFQTVTFRVRYDLSGTRIDSTESIAVFSGTANSTSVYTYTQLLPVELFSDEFVVAVDDSLPPFQLQIIGEEDGFEISFNNGTLASSNSTILNRFLVENETCHFASNKPVMVTLCRSFGNQTGFALLAPISMFTSYNGLNMEYTTAFVTHIGAELNIYSHMVDGKWNNISNTHFKSGIFTMISHNLYLLEFSGMFLSFRPETFYASGLSLAGKEKLINDPSEQFIFFFDRSNIVAVGETEAFYQVWCSGDDVNTTRYTYPYTEDYLELSRNSELCVLKTNNDQLHVFHLSHHKMSTILPVSSLGKKYIIPSYDSNIVRIRTIILATGKWTASVNVTTKGGIVYRYDLGEYQTISFRTVATEMVVSASLEIVVFIQQLYKDSFSRETFSQLTPSEDFGNEYVLAVGSLATRGLIFADNFTEEYYINITCLDVNTTIIFNNELTLIIAEEKFYHKDVMVNENLHFSSSKPVMVHLCLKAEFHFDDELFKENPCSILPPVERYGDSAVIHIPESADLMIITKQNNEDFDAFSVEDGTRNTNFIPNWKDIPNTNFKVGTAQTRTGTIFMKSTHSFSVIVYGFLYYGIPKFDALLSISTSYPRIRRTASSKSSTMTPLNAGSTTELTSTSTPHDYQVTGSSSFISSTTSTDLTSPISSNTPHDDGNIVIGEDRNANTLIVGCVCGFIILVLGCIVGFLVMRLRRKSQSKFKNDTQAGHESRQEQETSFGGEHTTPETKDQGSRRTLEGELHTYSELNVYENVGGEQGNRPHANNYSDLSFDGKPENQYEKIVHKRRNTDSDYANC